MEMGTQNQQRINQYPHNNSTQSTYIVNNNQNRNCTTNITQQRQSCNRNAKALPQYQFTSVCCNCKHRWTYNHRKNCPAKGKAINNFGIPYNFAMMFRKPKKSQLQTSPPEKNEYQPN